MDLSSYENHPQRDLKIRLKVKRLSKQLDAAIEWNFGYSPSNNKRFDEDLELRNELARMGNIEV